MYGKIHSEVDPVKVDDGDRRPEEEGQHIGTFYPVLAIPERRLYSDHLLKQELGCTAPSSRSIELVWRWMLQRDIETKLL